MSPIIESWSDLPTGDFESSPATVGVDFQAMADRRIEPNFRM
jgi:hypothetical protein